MTQKQTGGQTSSRKAEHIDLCLNEDVAFSRKSNGLERWEFEHNALPEIDFSETDTRIEFLGKNISFPLLITGMTGGYADAEEINAGLARVCESMGIAIGSGSQRQALENSDYHDSFRTLRRNAPSVPVVGNIGASEIAGLTDVSRIRTLVDILEADAIAVHINPLQEFLQPEGDTNFRGVLEGIETLAGKLDVPLLVKEVGAGLSPSVIRRLADAGVTMVDIAGAGGTSWAAVEILRRDGGFPVSSSFRDWGVPLAEVLHDLNRDRPDELTVIASGGIMDGVMIAKSLALGADLCGAARPLLQELLSGGEEALRNLLTGWQNDLRGAMFLTGSTSVAGLRTSAIINKR